MPPKLTQEELLEQSRKTSAESYAKKISELQKEINSLIDKRNNIQELFDDEFSTKKEEIKKLELELRQRLDNVRSNEINSNKILQEVTIKFNGAKALESDLKEKHETHKAIVDSHNATADATNRDLAERTAQCVAREEESRAKIVEASRRLEIAIEQEKRHEIEATKLVHIAQNINDDIVKQQELKKQNIYFIEQIELKKSEIQILNNTVEESRKENEKLRADLDAATYRLANRKLELDKKEESLKGQVIQNEVQLKKIQENKQDIDQQSAKLNELKNNVETLMQKRGA